MASPSNDTAAPARTDAALARLLHETARNETHAAASALVRASYLEQAARPHATCCVPWGVLRFVSVSVADRDNMPDQDDCAVEDVDHEAGAHPEAVALARVTRAAKEIEQAIAAIATAAAALEAAAPAGGEPQTRVDLLWFFAGALHSQSGSPGALWRISSRARDAVAQIMRRHHDGEGEAR